MDEPLFESTRNAIKFAFGYSTEQYGESVLGKLQRRDAGSGKGLVGMDGAGQAGMVLAEVWRLKPLERAAMDGKAGDPSPWRDYVVPPPPIAA